MDEDEDDRSNSEDKDEENMTDDKLAKVMATWLRMKR